MFSAARKPSPSQAAADWGSFSAMELLERRLQPAATQKPPAAPCLAGVKHIISRQMQRGTPDPKSEPQPRRAGPPHNAGLRRLIECKRKWHRPERTLTLPPEGSVPNASGTPASAGSNPETASSP